MFLINRSTIEAIMVYSEEIRAHLADLYLPYILNALTVFMIILVTLIIAVDIISNFAKLESADMVKVLPRPLLMIVVLYGYEYLIEFLVIIPAQYFYEITKFGADAIALNSFGQQGRDIVQEMLSWSGSEQNNDFKENQDQGYVGFIAMIVQFVCLCCGAYVVTKGVIASNLFFITGPFIIVMSLIPGNRVVLKKLWMGYIGVCLWPAIVTIVISVITILPYYTQNWSGGNEFISYIWGFLLQIIGIYSIFAVQDYSRAMVYIASSAVGNGLGSGYQRFTQGVAKYLSHSAARAVSNKFKLHLKLMSKIENMKKSARNAASSTAKSAKNAGSSVVSRLTGSGGGSSTSSSGTSSSSGGSSSATYSTKQTSSGGSFSRSSGNKDTGSFSKGSE